MRLPRIEIRLKAAFLPLLAWAIFTAGCAARPVVIAVDVMKPAEVDLGAVRKIAIADFQGSGGSVVSNKMVTKLLAGRRFDVLERGRLARIMEELALSQSGVIDLSTAAKVGKAAGVDALIFGEVDAYRVADERVVTPLRKSRVVGYDIQCDRKGNCYKVPITEPYTVNAPTTIRRGHVSVSFRVVGVESGQILAAKSASRKWEGLTIVDPRPDSEETLGSALAAALMGQSDPRGLRASPCLRKAPSLRNSPRRWWWKWLGSFPLIKLRLKRSGFQPTGLSRRSSTSTLALPRKHKNTWKACFSAIQVPPSPILL